MLIRSQDKKALCLLSNVEIVERYKRKKDGEKMITGYAVYIFGERDTELFLAEYSTEEKAIKVLDMIEDFYINLEFAKFNGREREGFAEQIFYMPQEDDV